MANMGHFYRTEMGERMTYTEELAYQHLVAQLKNENEMLKEELISLRRLLTKQK